MKDNKTPLIKQYNEIKRKHPDSILLFQVGDFYEMFGDDAIKGSKILGIALTKRINKNSSYIELAGFPCHSLDNYLPKLINKGYRIAVCNQLEDSKIKQGIIERRVTELITPGVTFNDQTLNSKSNNFILSVNIQKTIFGISILDISTGEFLLTEGTKNTVLNIISTYKPSEILIPKNHRNFLKTNNYIITPIEECAYQYDFAYEKLCSHFEVNSLKGFGIEKLSNGICAAGSILTYLVEDTYHYLLKHISSIQKIEDEHLVSMDEFTQRNLELTSCIHDRSITLFNFLDGTQTGMGGRLLKRWITFPSKNDLVIKERWEIVSLLISNDVIRNTILNELKNVPDLERLLAKVASEKINPRELGMIRSSLQSIKKIEQLIQTDKALLKLIGKFHNHSNLINDLSKSLEDELPTLLSKGNIIKHGFSSELDDLRKIVTNNKNFLENLSKELSEKTKISSLKIDFNSVFGYYIEVRNTHKNKVPLSWVRKQTLVNSERYITEDLKEYENKIFGAENKILYLETFLYKKIIRNVVDQISSIQYNTRIIARLDVLINFSLKSIENKYSCPKISNKLIIKINNGRHPIIEKSLPIGEPYIANSIEINKKSHQILIITGPNMGGKSAFLRQIALIIIMAQIGCYVPAKYLEFSIVDKIFTRVGASDNLSQGESTFMMEMHETSAIVNNLTKNSLILLDEVGRGTSTYDGISIAWSIIEYLHEHSLRPLTLFATHYHELIQMSTTMNRIKNFSVSIKEISGRIIFLRKLIEGGSQHSFGIHILKLAGIPDKIIQRAKEILSILESRKSIHLVKNQINTLEKKNFKKSYSFQDTDNISIALLYDVYKKLLEIDTNNMTPFEALIKIRDIQKMIK